MLRGHRAASKSPRTHAAAAAWPGANLESQRRRRPSRQTPRWCWRPGPAGRRGGGGRSMREGFESAIGSTRRQEGSPGERGPALCAHVHADTSQVVRCRRRGPAPGASRLLQLHVLMPAWCSLPHPCPPKRSRTRHPIRPHLGGAIGHVVQRRRVAAMVMRQVGRACSQVRGQVGARQQAGRQRSLACCMPVRARQPNPAGPRRAIKTPHPETLRMSAPCSSAPAAPGEGSGGPSNPRSHR